MWQSILSYFSCVPRPSDVIPYEDKRMDEIQMLLDKIYDGRNVSFTEAEVKRINSAKTIEELLVFLRDYKPNR